MLIGGLYLLSSSLGIPFLIIFVMTGEGNETIGGCDYYDSPKIM